jgi:hypothetical protein
MKTSEIIQSVFLEPGLYTNVFEVVIPAKPVDVMVASTSHYPDLRPLREEIERNSWRCRVYRVRDQVFGYGGERNVLANKLFRATQLSVQNEPALCTRLILEGLSDQLRNKGYREWSRKARLTLYEPEPYRDAAGGRLQVYRGYDLRSIWWKQERQVRFGIVVDVRWEIQDKEGKRLSTPEIAGYKAVTGYKAVIEIGQIQDEFLTNEKINTEVARLRLQNHILPWVRDHSRFSLPCGGEATISTMPVRVIMGA